MKAKIYENKGDKISAGGKTHGVRKKRKKEMASERKERGEKSDKIKFVCGCEREKSVRQRKKE